MQIVLDKQAALSYMVKYATKGEKAGKEFTKLYKDVISASNDEDNPKTKMRSLMLRSIAGKILGNFYKFLSLKLIFKII